MKGKMRLPVSVSIILTLVFAIPIDGSYLYGEGRVLYVGGSGEGNYSSIQQAVDDAGDGDTIFVYGGVYNESVLVNKQIKLMGESRDDTIIAAATGYAINVTANNVEISHFTITGGSYPHAGIVACGVENLNIHDCNFENNDCGLSVFSSYGSTISGCDFLDGFSGIVIVQSHDVVVSDCTISNITGSAFSKYAGNISEFEGCGISLEGCQNVTISNNQISLSDIAISLWSASHNNISLNTLHDNIGGVLLAPYSDYNIISENTVTQEDSFGISIQGGSFNRISQNDVEECKGWCAICIVKGWSRGNNISENRVVHSKIGISVEGVKNTVYRNNISLNTDFGLYLGSFLATRCRGNVIQKNNFIENGVDASFCTPVLSFNRWIGNYWSGHSSGPKIISGKIRIPITPFYAIELPWINVDFHPAKEPYY